MTLRTTVTSIRSTSLIFTRKKYHLPIGQLWRVLVTRPTSPHILNLLQRERRSRLQKILSWNGTEYFMHSRDYVLIIVIIVYLINWIIKIIHGLSDQSLWCRGLIFFAFSFVFFFLSKSSLLVSFLFRFLWTWFLFFFRIVSLFFLGIFIILVFLFLLIVIIVSIWGFIRNVVAVFLVFLKINWRLMDTWHLA